MVVLGNLEVDNDAFPIKQSLRLFFFIAILGLQELPVNFCVLKRNRKTLLRLLRSLPWRHRRFRVTLSAA